MGHETNALYRQTFAATLHSDWGFGTSRLLAQYENTRNRRLDEGQSGSGDGVINTSRRQTSTYDGYLVQGQLDLPLETALNQVLTLGAEWNRQELDDPATFDRAIGAGTWYALPNSGLGRSTRMDATLMAMFVEDNIELTPAWILTPALRLDHHDRFGANWSPSLNTTYALTEDITLVCPGLSGH